MPPARRPKAASTEATPDLAALVGRNLRRLRSQKGLSLEGLARISGASRAMLSQIELGRSAPTITLMWKIARALQVPFAALLDAPLRAGLQVLRADQAKILRSGDGRFSSRALFPFDGARDVEFYELRIAPGAKEQADAHAPGTSENLVVAQGSIDIRIGEDSHRLKTGDAILFTADLPHSYDNRGTSEAVLYLVMTYIDPMR